MIGITDRETADSKVGLGQQRLIAAVIVVLFSCVPAFAQSAPSTEVLKDLAPTGKLRAAMNFGNGMLSRRDRTARRTAFRPSSRRRSPSG
jgi:hypothetical protein